MVTNTSDNLRRGFTLVELLVVISTIGLLSSVVFSVLGSARTKAKTAKVQEDLHQLRLGIGLLEDDTGKWPNGCPPGQESNPEVALNTGQAGISISPTVQDNGGGCAWTASDVAKWKGPYAPTAVDPWGRPYWFDADYEANLTTGLREDCNETTNTFSSNYHMGLPKVQVVFSLGEQTSGWNAPSVRVYDCDDILLKI